MTQEELGKLIEDKVRKQTRKLQLASAALGVLVGVLGIALVTLHQRQGRELDAYASAMAEQAELLGRTTATLSEVQKTARANTSSVVSLGMLVGEAETSR